MSSARTCVWASAQPGQKQKKEKWAGFVSGMKSTDEAKHRTQDKWPNLQRGWTPAHY